MITTTLDKAYTAFLALNKIRGMVKGMDALHVFHMKNKVKETVDFLAEEEVKAVEEFGGKITETGMVLFADNGKRQAYNKERERLGKITSDIEAEPVRIRIDRCPEVTAEDIEALDGFVIFEEEEDNGNK